MARVLVLFHSAYGHLETAAHATTQGARSSGANADVKWVPGVVPSEIALKTGYKIKQEAPAAAVAKLEHCGGANVVAITHKQDAAAAAQCCTDVTLVVNNAGIASIGSSLGDNDARAMLKTNFFEARHEHRSGAWRSLRSSFRVPAQVRRTMWQVLPVNTAQWALEGFYLSLGPTLARMVTGRSAPLVGGRLIAALVLSSAVAIALIRQRTPHSALLAGAAALAIGVATAMAGVQLHSTALFFAGTVIAGLGFGAACNGSMRSLVPLAAPHERAALMSGFFVLGYLAFSLHAIAAGLLTGQFGLQPVATGYGLVLVVIATAAWLAIKLRGITPTIAGR